MPAMAAIIAITTQVIGLANKAAANAHVPIDAVVKAAPIEIITPTTAAIAVRKFNPLTI